MTVIETCERVEADIKAQFPELAGDNPFYFQSDGAGAGHCYGYDYYIPVAFSTTPPYIATPAVDARGRAAIAFPWPPADNRVWHERGHSIEALALVRGQHGYVYNKTPAAYDPEAFQEKFWKLIGGEGTYFQHYNGSLISRSPETFAEAFALVAGPAFTTQYAMFGASVQRGDPALLAFFRGLLAPAAVVQPPKAKQVDLRGELPRADWSIGSSDKSGIVIHWNGTPLPDDVADIDVIFGDASYHMSPTWPGRAGGADGIMYHRLYGRDGTVYLTRDSRATLWHCGNVWGNENTEAWQVMCGKGQSATPAQLAALSRDLAVDGRPRQGHRDLSPTQCPGDELEALISEEDDLTPEAFKQLFIANMLEEITPTLNSMKKVYDPLVAKARENGLVDAEQEAAIADLSTRLERMGAAAQGK
jgi:hypothetical protein